MSTSIKLNAGSRFPDISVTDLEGNNVVLGQPQGDASWQMVVVYRGKHCPLCTKYLNELEAFRERLVELAVDIVAVSADSREQLLAHSEKLEVGFPLTYGLSQEQMQTLGVYISLPRSEQETDHNFSEPALFVVNEEFNIQVVDYSNNPFVRPDLGPLISGIEWIRNPDNNYPVRGTFGY